MANAVRKGNLGSSSHDVTASRIRMKAGKGSSKVGDQNLAYSGIARQNCAMRIKGDQENQLIFKENSLRGQEQTVLLCRKMGNFRRPAWLSKGFLAPQ